MLRGAFFVIDGSDGSGKKTQTQLLTDRLKAEGYDVMSISFPSYGEASAAMVESYLNGDFGNNAEDINPYVASSFYAVDRFAHSHILKQALSEGKIIIADRYVSSNLAHQGGKFIEAEERRAYMQWQYDFEHEKARLPKPTLNIILHVPTEISMQLVTDRGNKKDLHEKDEHHLRRAEETYLELANLFPNTELIECVENNQLLTREQIHELVWGKVKEMLK